MAMDGKLCVGLSVFVFIGINVYVILEEYVLKVVKVKVEEVMAFVFWVLGLVFIFGK